MLEHEAEVRRESALERRRALARMTKAELIDRVHLLEAYGEYVAEAYGALTYDAAVAGAMDADREDGGER
jgi:hypothetical protein